MRRLTRLAICGALLVGSLAFDSHASADRAATSATSGGWTPLLAFGNTKPVRNDPEMVGSNTGLWTIAADEFHNFAEWATDSTQPGAQWFYADISGGQWAYSTPSLATGGGTTFFCSLHVDASLGCFDRWGPRGFDLGGALIAPPEAAGTPDHVYVFGVGRDHALWYRTYTSPDQWTQWASLGGYVSSGLSSVLTSSGIYVFARGGDNAVWYRRLNNSGWSEWRTIGGYVTTRPIAIVDGSDVFVAGRGGDDALWTQRVNNLTGSGWQSLGGRMLTTPTATADASGVYVAVVGSDHAIWTRRFSGTWSPWASLGGAIISEPVAATSPPTGPWVIGVGQDSGLSVRSL
jgi:hypothetical protein